MCTDHSQHFRSVERDQNRTQNTEHQPPPSPDVGTGRLMIILLRGRLIKKLKFECIQCAGDSSILTISKSSESFPVLQVLLCLQLFLFCHGKHPTCLSVLCVAWVHHLQVRYDHLLCWIWFGCLRLFRSRRGETRD